MKICYTPEELSEKTGLNAQFIRVNMDNGRLPIGIVSRKDGCARATYKIFPKMLYEVTGYRIDGYEPQPILVIAKEDEEVSFQPAR